MIQSLVIEVHDIENRLQNTKDLLASKGFSKLYAEREVGLEHTPMYNLFALRS